MSRKRAKENEKYYYISIDRIIEVGYSYEHDCYTDEGRWKYGNYFKTKKEAKEVIKKINNLFKELKS